MKPWNSQQISTIANRIVDEFIEEISHNNFEGAYQVVKRAIDANWLVETQIFAIATYEIIRLKGIGSRESNIFIYNIVDAQVEKVQGYR